MATDVKLKKRLFTAEEYERMVDAGVLSEDERVELIEGEIVEMSPIGKRHAAVVDRLTMTLAGQVAGKAIVRSQGPVRVGHISQLQPDVALLKFRDDYYSDSLPGPEDVLLLVEVSDTTLAGDRSEKVPLYARHGIPEVWLVNLRDDIVEVYSHPAKGTYSDVRSTTRGDQLRVPGVERVTIRVADILG